MLLLAKDMACPGKVNPITRKLDKKRKNQLLNFFTASCYIPHYYDSNNQIKLGAPPRVGEKEKKKKEVYLWHCVRELLFKLMDFPDSFALFWHWLAGHETLALSLTPKDRAVRKISACPIFVTLERYKALASQKKVLSHECVKWKLRYWFCFFP